MNSLYPRLIVADVDSAVLIYERVFGAELIERFEDAQGIVVHVAMRIEDGVFSMAQSVPEWGLFDPRTLGGSASLIHLDVQDPDSLADAMVREGGEVVVPVADRPWGKREGRMIDPAGHLWILSRRVEGLSAEEIAKRLKS